MVQLEHWQVLLVIVASAFAGHWLLRKVLPQDHPTDDGNVNRRIHRAYQELVGAFHHSKWLSVGVVCDMLHGLSQGNGIDIDHLRDYNAVQYLQLNGFSNDQIEEILEELDDEGERVGGINVGNVTGIGDDILPNIYQEAARLIRAQLAEIEVRKNTEQTLTDNINTLRDELQAQHLRDSLKEE